MTIRRIFGAILMGGFVSFWCVEAQLTSEQVDTRNVCSYAGESSPAKVMAFASDNEAQSAVQRIVDVSGLTQNFQIRAAGVSNAAAAVDGSKRFLLYNQTFMHDLDSATGSKWAALAVMAHEIGHHLNNHTLEPKRDPKFEIEADYFSGFCLEKLGAKLAEAQAALNYLPSDDSSPTHPPKHDRLAAVANGWTKACQSDAKCGRTPTTPTVPPEPEPRPRPKPSPNSCEYADDGACDEPDLCDEGTDTSDCKKKPSGPNSCEYARDGTCDEPDLCSRGTDTSDCGDRVKRRNQTVSPLYCCDAWGNRWCQITINPGPPGTPCYCAGVPGVGTMCQ